MLTDITNISDDDTIKSGSDTIKSGSVSSVREWRELKSIQKKREQHSFTKKDMEDWKLEHPEETELIQQIHSSKYKQTCAIIVSMAISKIQRKDKPTPMEEEPSKKASDPT